MHSRVLTTSLLLASSLLACSSEARRTTDSAAAKSPSSAAGTRSLTIAMIAKSSTNPVFLSGRKGAEDAADSLTKATGVTVKIDWLTPPNEDGAVQAQRIAQAVNGGANAILLSASDAGK